MSMIKMGHENPYALGNLALGCNACYSSNHGCASATYESMANADLPSYAHGFYSLTEHESLNEVRYSKMEIGYDSSLRDLKRALDGAPLEAYVPASFSAEDSGSAVPKTGAIEPIVIKNPDNKIVEEILKAQKEVMGKEIIMREVEIEEIIIKRRKVRKREVIVKEKDI